MGIFGQVERGLVFIVSAPAGTGKTTLVERLLSKYPQALRRSISCTTRPPRGHEKDGVDYIFLTKESFEKKIKEGAFLEYAQVFNHYYGTLKETVAKAQAEGIHVFLVIDTQGALFLKNEGFKAVFVFIMPPDIKTLRNRLEKRRTEKEEVIDLRLSHAKEEMEKAKYYDYIIVNDELNQATEDFKKFVEQREEQLCQYKS